MLLARSVPHKYLFLMLFHIKTLRGTVRFSNKFHQIKVFNVKITKNDQWFGTVRFALLRKISVKTVER
jgi:hypothetical protein